MSVTSGFYDTALVDGKFDREYSSLQMGSIFDGIITDGVYAAIGEHFKVKASQGMHVLVGSGRAWFNHSWLYSDNDHQVTIDTAESAQDRIDIVYLEINRDIGVRAGSIGYKKGTPSTQPTAPTLTRTLDVNQYPLAQIYVKAEAKAIGQVNITNLVGTSSCPFVTGPLNSITTDELVSQWEAQFELLFADLKNKIDQVTQGVIPDGAVSSEFKVLLPTSDSWTETDSDAYVTVSVPGLKSTDKPIVDIDFDRLSTFDQKEMAMDSWSVYQITPGNGNMRVRATSVPELAIPIKMLCVRK